MSKILTKLFTFILILTLCTCEVYAKRNIKIIADTDSDFTAKSQNLPDEISFRINSSKTIPNVISIPENSLITLKIIRTQRELRWHKSGIILCKLQSYTPEVTDIPIDVSDKNIYLTVRKYEEIDKKEAAILATEIIITQGAAFFAPGVDIGYFFIKGAIQREKDPNWFKAGVHNAYDNSICWFWLKGKPIELNEEDQVQIKDIKSQKVDKLIKKIDQRNARFERQAAHRIAKLDKKTLKKQIKNEKKLVDCSVVEQAIENVVVDRNVLAEIINSKIIDENTK